MLDDREAETCAAHLAGAGAVGSIKTLENTIDVLGHDPFAGVEDRDAITPIAAIMRNGDGTCLTIEFYGVVDKVCEHLLESHGIGGDDHFVIDLVKEVDLALGGLCRQSGHDLSYGRCESNFADVDAHLAGLDHRQLGDVVYEHLHPFGIAANDAEEAAVVFAILDTPVLERFDKGEYRCERRSQLVRDV